MFLTFEGPEGAGKTTQIQMLADSLRQSGYEVVATREPGGTPIGDQIRAILLNPQNAEMDSLAELLLYYAARAQHLRQTVVPALAKGVVVLCDRFEDATFAYQVGGRGLPNHWNQSLRDLVVADCLPHRTYLFDLPVEEGLRRSLHRLQQQAMTDSESRFEQETIEFHQRVRQSYLRRAEAEPQRFVLLDALQSVADLHAQLKIDVLRLLQKERES